MEAGANPRTWTGEGDTPLHLAAQNGHFCGGNGSVLVKAGACLEVTTAGTGQTPLHLAAQFGRTEATIALMVEADADLEIKAAGIGQTTLHLAVFNGRWEAMAALIKGSCGSSSHFHASHVLPWNSLP